jgi:PAS fold
VSRPAFAEVWSDVWAQIHSFPARRALGTLEWVLRGETAVTEYRVVRADGAVRWIRNTLFPISDEHGNVGRVGGVAQDVTQHDGSLVYVVDGDRMDPFHRDHPQGMRGQSREAAAE